MKNINKKTPIVIGWSNPEEVARDVWSGIHSSLLKGELLFAYQDGNYQLVVVRNSETDYGVGSMITGGYTMLIPHCPIDFMKEVKTDMSNQKVDKKIIEEFKSVFNI